MKEMMIVYKGKDGLPRAYAVGPLAERKEIIETAERMLHKYIQSKPYRVLATDFTREEVMMLDNEGFPMGNMLGLFCPELKYPDILDMGYTLLLEQVLELSSFSDFMLSKECSLSAHEIADKIFDDAIKDYNYNCNR